MKKALRSPALLKALTLLAAIGLSACSVDTTVSISASTPAQVQHLYVTLTEVWLSTSATAAPEDAGWVGSSLATPSTVDLSTLNGGTLTRLVSGVSIGAGTYKQLRIVLADSADALTAAAQSAGLTWNAEVQYLNAQGSSSTLPLELPSPKSQLIIPTTLVLNGNSAGAFLSTDTSGTDTSTTTTTTTSGSTASLASIVVNIDTVRNWVLFNYGSQTGALLSPAMAAYEEKKAGAISGSVDVSGVASNVLTGAQGILVTAEALSADGTRFQAIKSVALQSGGSFTLFPLPVADTGTGNYDLVIHGPGIRTVVLSQIPVSAGDATSATQVQSSAISLSTAKSYIVNTAANSAVLPGGSQVGFYQTVPGSDAPHLIEYAMPDPFSGGFAANLVLSADAIDYGNYNGGSDISISSSAPDEGIGTYRIGADAPLRVSSSLSTTISAPSVVPRAVQPVFLPPLSAAGNAILSGSVNFSQAGRFDQGFLLISRGGQLVDALDLSASLAGLKTSIAFSDSALPGGVGVRYDVAVRMWNSRDPAGTIARAAAAAPADLSAQGVTIFVP